MHQLVELMPILGVELLATQVLDTFTLLCEEALAPPGEDCVPRASRINEDGTPFQFALTLTPPFPLQFLSEPTRSSASNPERLRAAHDRIDALASLFRIDNVYQVHSWLGRTAPDGDPDLAADDAGPVWLGAAFTRSGSPKFKVYVNAKWGPPRDRWARIALLADYVGAAVQWDELRPLLQDGLQPLGMSLVFCADAPLEGRMYFRGPDLTFDDYEALAIACGCVALRSRLPMLKRQLLADDAAFALRSAVCSFGLKPNIKPEYKFEICAHCAFENDIVARERCCQWLNESGFDVRSYLRFIDVLSPGVLSTRRTRLHSFVGIGERHGVPYPTLYFNPGAAL